MGLGAAEVLAAVVVVTETELAAAAVAIAGSGPHRCEGTPLVQGSPTHG